MIKMIVTDLDNTLLGDRERISAYSCSVIQKVQDVGIFFVIATARSVSAARNVIKDICPDWTIYNNGALIMQKTYEMGSASIAVSIANVLLAELVRDNNVKVIKVSTYQSEYASRRGLIKNGIHYKYIDFQVGLTEDVYKIMVKADTSFLPFKYVCKYGVKYYATRDWTYVFINQNASKMNAIQEIAKKKHIKSNEIIAFGDDQNDIEMLMGCGKGIAVKNAIPEVRDISDMVCRENLQDGVAAWIEENILNKGGK